MPNPENIATHGTSGVSKSQIVEMELKQEKLKINLKKY